MVTNKQTISTYHIVRGVDFLLPACLVFGFVGSTDSNLRSLPSKDMRCSSKSILLASNASAGSGLLPRGNNEVDVQVAIQLSGRIAAESSTLQHCVLDFRHACVAARHH